ncbi:MAG: cupin domain-containing protein [Pseudomonadales bacterium]
MADKPHPHVSAAMIAAMAEKTVVHQYNDNAVRHTKSLTDPLGFEDMGVHLVRIESGRDSTTFHSHHYDEEFLYIVSGRGLARIGSEETEVGPGDFMGFTKHSLPHSLHNPFSEDLVYLMGGTRAEVDVCDYPDLERRQYRLSGKREYVDSANLHPVKQR